MSRVFGKKPSDTLTVNLEETVREIRGNQKWEAKYMKYQELLAEAEAEATARISRLSILMKKEGRAMEFVDALGTPEKLTLLYKEYGLS